MSRIWHAAIYSFAGFRSAWQNEAVFRQEAVLAPIVLPGVYWMGDTSTKKVFFGTLALVFIVELFNSAIDAIVGRIGPEIHPLSGRAKDMGSAAVFVSLVLVAIVWGTFAFEFFGVF